MIGQDIKG